MSQLSSHRKWELERRSFLRGCGATIGLPVLEAMLPSVARANPTDPHPVRTIYYFTPNGANMYDWRPAEGAGHLSSPILSQLDTDTLRNEVSVITGLNNDAVVGESGHFGGTASVLTAHPIIKSETDLGNNTSADQISAEVIGHHTPFRSLQLGLGGAVRSGAGSAGYGAAYVANISWKTNQPLINQTRPRLVFQRLFSVSRNAQQDIRRRQSSLLDFVRQDIHRLKRRLGHRDQQKVDLHLTSIRELETRLNKTPTRSCEPPSEPIDTADYLERFEQMQDLMVLALKCDLTRTISFMAHNGGCQRRQTALQMG